MCPTNFEQDQTCPGTKEGSQDRVRGPNGVAHTKWTLSTKGEGGGRACAVTLVIISMIVSIVYSGRFPVRFRYKMSATFDFTSIKMLMHKIKKTIFLTIGLIFK